MYLARLSDSIDSSIENISVNSSNGLPSGGGYYLGLSDADNNEVLYVISRIGKALFVKRGQADTTAQSWADDTLIRDLPAPVLVAGDNVSLTYDVLSDSIKIDSTGGGGGSTSLETILSVSSLRI